LVAGSRSWITDEAFREINLARNRATDSKEGLSIVCNGVDLQPRNISFGYKPISIVARTYDDQASGDVASKACVVVSWIGLIDAGVGTGMGVGVGSGPLCGPPGMGVGIGVGLGGGGL
jgi:hypothetical protein